MPTLIESPTTVPAAGRTPKAIDEYVGRVNSATTAVSVAHMRSPQGWTEPGQTPQFDEFTIVLKGVLRVEPSTLPFVCRRFRRTSSGETHITFNVRVGDAGRHPLPE